MLIFISSECLIDKPKWWICSIIIEITINFAYNTQVNSLLKCIKTNALELHHLYTYKSSCYWDNSRFEAIYKTYLCLTHYLKISNPKLKSFFTRELIIPHQANWIPYQFRYIMMCLNRSVASTVEITFFVFTKSHHYDLDWKKITNKL